MSMLEKRGLLILGLVLSLIAASLAALLPSSDQRLALFQKTGFYSILITFLLWLASWPTQRLTWPRVVLWWRGNGLAVSLALTLTATAFLVSPPQFRVLADETNLSGMAMNMFYRRQITNPLETLPFCDGMHDVVHETVDKRPLAFPFLLFSAHTLLGYRPQNAFVLNFALSILLLLQFHLLLRRWFSRFWSMIGMLLLSVYPVVVSSMTSAGFEVLNLLFIIFAFRCLEAHLRLPSFRRAEHLVWTLILLAQCRYESAIFLLLMLPPILWRLRHEREAALSPRALVLPCLFLPVLWQRLSFLSDSLFDLPPGKSAFSVEWLLPNLDHAWRFFWGAKASYGMIPLLTIGAVAGIFTLLSVIRHRTCSDNGTSLTCASVATIAGILQLGILMLYFWGNLTHRYAFRFGMVFIPGLIFLNLHWISLFVNPTARQRYLIVLGCLGLMLYYRPVAGMNSGPQGMLIWREFQQVHRYLESTFPQRNVLLISHRPSLFTPFRWGAISPRYAAEHTSELAHRLELGSFQQILIHQCIRVRDGKVIDPDTETEISLVPSTASSASAGAAAGLFGAVETVLVSTLSEEYQLRILRVRRP